MRTRKTALTEQSFKQSLEGKEFMSPSCGGPVRINGGRVVLNGYEDVTDSCDWSKLMDEYQAWNIGGAYQRMTASDASTESSRYIAHIGDRVRYQTEDGSEGEGILQDVQLGMDNGFHDNFYIIKKDDGEEARIPTFSLLMFQKVSMKKTSDINPDDYSYETYYDEIGKLDSEGREVRWLNVNRTGPKGSHQVASIPVHEGQTDPMRLIEDLKAVDRMGMEGREWSEAFNRVFDKYMVPGMDAVISASGMGELYRYSSEMKRTALTGWLEGMTEDEVKGMPVQVVFEDPSGRGLKSEEYPNFQAALSAGHDFIRPNDWQNAMKGVSYETNATVLRFESPEAYRILSASKRVRVAWSGPVKVVTDSCDWSKLMDESQAWSLGGAYNKMVANKKTAGATDMDGQPIEVGDKVRAQSLYNVSEGEGQTHDGGTGVVTEINELGQVRVKWDAGSEGTGADWNEGATLYVRPSVQIYEPFTGTKVHGSMTDDQTREQILSFVKDCKEKGRSRTECISDACLQYRGMDDAVYEVVDEVYGKNSNVWASKKTAADESALKFSATVVEDTNDPNGSEGMFFVDVKCTGPDGTVGEWSEWYPEADAKRYSGFINQNPTFQYMQEHRGSPEADMMHEAWQDFRSKGGQLYASRKPKLGDHVTGMSITLAGKNIRVAGVLLRNEYEDIYTVRTANGDYPVIERDLKSAPKKYASIADEIQDLKGRKEMLEVEYDSAETDDQKAAFTARIDELDREINALEAKTAMTDPTFFGHGLKCAEIEGGNTPTLTSPSTEEISDNADVPLSMRPKGEPGEGSEYRTKISRRRRTAEDAIKAGDDVVVFADAAHEIGQYGGKVVEVKPNGYAMVESYKFPGDPEEVGLAWVEKISPEEAADWGKVGSKRIAGQTICRKCGAVFVPTTDDPVEEAEDLGWEIGQIGGYFTFEREIGQIGGYVTFENSLCPDCRKRRKSGSVRSADNGAAPTIGGAPEGLDDVEGEKKTAEVELDENIFESEDDAPHRFRGEEKDQSVMRSSSDGAKGYQSSGPFVAPPSALPGAYASCPTGIPKDVKDEVIDEYGKDSPKTYMTLNKIKDDMKEGKTASFMGDQMDEIFKAKVEQYVAEGMSEEEAKKKAEDAVLSEYSFWAD